jgi:AraC family transcriptional regulator, regulatory protein of adaptative response / DNA-3-methyladenine glycosylase II
VSGDSYWRTIVVGANPRVLELVPGSQNHLLLRAYLPHWEEPIHVVDRARCIASLDLDLGEPTVHLADDPISGRLVNRPLVAAGR